MTMTTDQLNKNPFIGKTNAIPRPSHDAATDGPLGPGGQERLTRDQREYDLAARWDAENVRLREERISRIAAAHEADQAKKAEIAMAARARRLAANEAATGVNALENGIDRAKYGI